MGIVLLLLLLSVNCFDQYNEGEIHPKKHIDTLEFEKLETLKALPEQFTWQNKDGVNYLTAARNQHIPENCGGCWAFSVTSVMSDRIKIL